MTKATFTARKFTNATTKIVEWGNAVDTVRENGSAALLTWAQQSVAGIRAGKLSLDDIQAAIIKATHKAQGKAATLTLEEMKLNDCGSTIKGRYHALKRIVAHEPSGDAILKGEAFNPTAKAAPSIQKQEKGKRASGKGNGSKGKPVGLTLAQSIDGLESWIEAACKEQKSALELANNPRIAALVKSLAKLEKAAKPAAKPAARQRKRKAA